MTRIKSHTAYLSSALR